MAKAPTLQDRTKKFDDGQQVAMARSRIYLVLAFGFRYPSEESLTAIREELTMLGSEYSKLADSVTATLREIETALQGASFNLIEQEYLRVFTHVIATDCHPCETAYTATHLFQQAQKIADLNGFYQAFGVEPGMERSDHIAVELEFMAFLTQKEAFAASRHRPRRIFFARDSQRKFLEKHLGIWVRAFCRFVQIKADGGFFGALANLSNAFFESELLALKANVKEVTGPPKPLPLLEKEEEDDEEGCPDFSVAEPSSYARGVLGANLDSSTVKM